MATNVFAAFTLLQTHEYKSWRFESFISEDDDARLDRFRDLVIDEATKSKDTDETRTMAYMLVHMERNHIETWQRFEGESHLTIVGDVED